MRPVNGTVTRPGPALVRTSVPRTTFRRSIAIASVERSLTENRSAVPAGARLRLLLLAAICAVPRRVTRKRLLVRLALLTTGAVVSAPGPVGPAPGAGWTATTRCSLALLPASSVAVIVTTAGPGWP